MNDERIEGNKKEKKVFHSIVTLHSAPLNRNRHSQERMDGRKGVCRSSLLGAISEKQDFLSLSHGKFDVSQWGPNLLIAEIADWKF